MRAHYARIGADVAGLLAGRSRPVLLDYGCGDALAAPAIAASGAQVLLYDRAPAVQARLARRFAGTAGVTVLDDTGFAALAPGSVDVVLVNSVLQYVPPAETRALLAALLPLLAPGGELLLADVVPPGLGMAADVAALLGPAVRHGYLVAALATLLRNLLSDYRRIRREAGFTVWRVEEIAALAAPLAARTERLARNVGFHQGRMTLRLTRQA